MGKKKKNKGDIIRLERESVVPIMRQKIISTLADLIVDKSEREEFLKLCQKIEYMIRAWYNIQFDELLQLFTLFEPAHGADKLAERNLSAEEIDDLEENFLTNLFQMMNKSNFKITTDEEIETALSATYRLNLPIVVDESKVDNVLLARYFEKNPFDGLPNFADKFIIFRRGIGIDKMTAYFVEAKINTIIVRFCRCFLKVTGLKLLIRYIKGCRARSYKENSPEPLELKVEAAPDDVFVERIRIERLNLGICNLISKITIQEPTFERIIVIYRRKGKRESERNIYVKHFKNIPMADMEIVLPEKKNPGLTPMDWVKFLISAAIGMVTVISSLKNPKVDIRVIFGILSAVVGYCVKTYFSFQQNLVTYQSLITRCVYDKQLDSGRGTVLHLCDEVIQQEVKEVIVSFFVLMRENKAIRKENLDLLCEELISETFGEKCNFDVDDAVRKLEKLGLLRQDETGSYTSVDVRHANEIIGTTTEEFVLKAKDGGSSPLNEIDKGRRTDL